jgi:hypothetical protein
VRQDNRLVYHAEPELELETHYACGVEGCSSICFDRDFADGMGCAIHGVTMVRVVRQFQNGQLVSEFREKLE